MNQTTEKVLTVFSFAMLAIASVIYYVDQQKLDARELYRAWDSYQIAAQNADKSALKTLLTQAKSAELDAPDASEKLQMINGLSPKNPRITGVRHNKDDAGNQQASLDIEADPENGALITGEVKFIKEDGEWKIDHVSWNLQMQTADTPSSAASSNTPSNKTAHAASPDFVLLSPEAAAVLDRIAGNDMNDAIAAWNELAYNYMSAGDFIKDYEGGLYDERQIPFDLVEQRWRSPEGQILRYYEAKAERPVEPLLLSYALRTHLWRLSDASGAGFVSLESWWPVFEKSRGLSAQKEVMTGKVLTGAAAEKATKEAFPALDPKVPANGFATVTLDGIDVVFGLATGFFSETEFKDPAVATIEFRYSPPDTDDNFLLVLSFDATDTSIQETNGSTVQVEHRRNGQRYFPDSPCHITIIEAYSGKADSALEGSVDNCTVHSAGIDHTLSLSFSVNGILTPTKK